MSELILLSGGIDSIALAAWRRPTLCLTIDYGQRPAEAEIQAARQVCSDLGLAHEVLVASIPRLGVGDLAGQRPSSASQHSEFWPYRNQYLITLGAMVALQRAIGTILIGTVSTDVRHRDGSPAFLTAIDQLISLQEGGVRILAPGAALTSVELVHASRVPDDTLAWAHSCHIGNVACGFCRGCQKHSEVMSALGWAR